MTTLEQAQEWLRKHVDEGAKCPCCTQLAKVYRRKINAGAARALVRMVVRYGEGEWVHVPTTADFSRLGGEWAKLRFWGLVVEQPEVREDGGRAGYWQVTPLGRAFALGRARVPKYARIYDQRLLGLVDEQTVDIHDALGTKFNLEDLMAGR